MDKHDNRQNKAIFNNGQNLNLKYTYCEKKIFDFMLLNAFQRAYTCTIL